MDRFSNSQQALNVVEGKPFLRWAGSKRKQLSRLELFWTPSRHIRYWAAAGFKDTELGVLMKPEVRHVGIPGTPYLFPAGFSATRNQKQSEKKREMNMVSPEFRNPSLFKIQGCIPNLIVFSCSC